MEFKHCYLIEFIVTINSEEPYGWTKYVLAKDIETAKSELIKKYDYRATITNVEECEIPNILMIDAIDRMFKGTEEMFPIKTI